MSLKDLECIRTLGNFRKYLSLTPCFLIFPVSVGMSTDGRVVLASAERPGNTGKRPLFAVKAIRRKAYRKDISNFALQDKSDPAEVARHHFESQSKERSALVDLPWNPFVAGLIQTFQDSQSLYMALEFIPGGTLRSLLRQSPNGLGHQRASFYLGNIVCGLDFLREMGIAHRNLRPESILLGGDGYLSLSCFEEARPFDNKEPNWTMSRREYAPPECRSNAKTPLIIVPEAIDWWSSGCILFEMMTGEMVRYCVYCIQREIDYRSIRHFLKKKVTKPSHWKAGRKTTNRTGPPQLNSVKN